MSSGLKFPFRRAPRMSWLFFIVLCVVLLGIGTAALADQVPIVCMLNMESAPLYGLDFIVDVPNHRVAFQEVRWSQATIEPRQITWSTLPPLDNGILILDRASLKLEFDDYGRGRNGKPYYGFCEKNPQASNQL